MIKNILFYIICLIVLGGLFIRYNEYLFLLLIIFLLIAPIIFILINIYVKRHLDTDILLASKNNNKDNSYNFDVKITNRGLLPIRKLAVILKYKNSKSSTKVSKKIIFTSVTFKSDEVLKCNIKSSHCGIMDITLEKVKIYDPFSITFLSKKIKKKINCIVLPKLYKEEENIKNDSFYEEDEGQSEVQYTNNYINNEIELVDYSEYKDGDSINKINWKLSAKKDKLFVKNYEGRENKIGLIIIENITKETDSYEKILQKVFSISMNYIDSGIKHKIVWYDNDSSKYVCDYIDNSENAYLAIKHIMECNIISDNYNGIQYLEDNLNCSSIYYVSNKAIRNDIKKKHKNINIVKIDEGKEYKDSSIIISKDIGLGANNYKKLPNIVYLIFEILLCTSFVSALIYEVFSKLSYFFYLRKRFTLFIPLIFLCVAILLIIFNIKSKKIRRIGICVCGAIYSLAIFIYRDILLGGILIIEDCFMDKFDKSSEYINYTSFVSVHSTYFQAALIILILIIVLITFISCIFISHKPCSMIVIILSAAAITIDILLKQKINLCVSFFMIISIIYSIFKFHKYTLKKKNNNNVFLFKKKKSYLINKEYYRNISVLSSAILLCVVTVILSLSFIIVRPSIIQNNKVSQFRVQMNNALFESKSIKKVFDYIFLGKASGGINEGILGNIGEIEYDNTTHLKVTIDRNNFSDDIYLKGYVGDVYTGNSFKQSSEEDFKLDDNIEQSDIFNSEYSFNENMFTIQKKADLSKVNTDSVMRNDSGYTYSIEIDPSDKNRTGFVFPNMVQSTIQVNNIAANNKYVYVPYNGMYNIDNACYYNDLTISQNEKQDQYNCKLFLSSPDSAMLTNEVIPKDQKEAYYSYNQLVRREKIYRQYVYDKYTKLPDEGVERIKDNFKNIKDRDFSFSDYGEYVYKVEDYIINNAQYSLSPGKTPKNKDFVEYFLYENKKGYCCHFAAAATVIFRAMGIPSRYVEGYVVRKNEYNYEAGAGEYINSSTNKFGKLNEEREPGSIINVKDSSAHAWTEIYIDGYGWIPIDVVKIINDINKSDENYVTSDLHDDKNSSNDGLDNKSDNSNSNDNNTNSTNDNKSLENNNNGINNNSSVGYNTKKLIIYTLLIIISLIILLYARIIFIKAKRNKLFNKSNNNDATKNMSEYFMKVISFNNSSYDNLSYKELVKLINKNYNFINPLECEEAIKIMYKAKFSNKKINGDEKEKVSKFILNFSKKLYYTLKLYDKIKFRLIKVL